MESEGVAKEEVCKWRFKERAGSRLDEGQDIRDDA
jgi:hypothetical protein